MSTFIIAFIIFALAGLASVTISKAKALVAIGECSCPVKEEMHKANR